MSDERPYARLLDGPRYLQRLALEAAQAAIENEEGYDTGRVGVLRLACDVAGKIREALLIGGADRVQEEPDWYARLGDEIPDEPLSRAAWIMRRCLDIADLAMGENDIDVARHREALFNLLAAVKIEPLEERVQAIEGLRRSNRERKARPGPALQSTEIQPDEELMV